MNSLLKSIVLMLGSCILAFLWGVVIVSIITIVTGCATPQVQSPKSSVSLMPTANKLSKSTKLVVVKPPVVITSLVLTLPPSVRTATIQSTDDLIHWLVLTNLTTNTLVLVNDAGARFFRAVITSMAVNLTWSLPESVPDVKIYSGNASRKYDHVHDTGSASTGATIVLNPVYATNYIAATTYDPVANNESEFSNEATVMCRSELKITVHTIEL